MSQENEAIYQQVISAVLRKIRGKTSQAHMSAKLGLKHNHIYKWESGERKIQWEDFVRLCDLRKIEVQPLFSDLYGYDGKPQDFAAICHQIFMDLPSQSLSKQLGISKFRIDSWRNGKGPFYLQDLVCILDEFSHCLAEFCLHFLSLEEVREIDFDLTEYEMRQFEVKNPIISLILRVLETTDHIQSTQDSSRFVARMLDLKEDEVDSLLEQARKLGIVSKKDDKYFSNERHVDIRGKRAIEQRRFWLKKALEFLDEGKFRAPDHIFGYVVYCVSQDGQNQILNEYLNFYNNTRQIIEKDKGGNVPMVLNMQMLRMDKR